MKNLEKKNDQNLKVIAQLRSEVELLSGKLTKCEIKGKLQLKQIGDLEEEWKKCF